MISSIEKGIYIPNAILLAKLCMKLNISMDNAVLSNYLEIEELKSFNTKIKTLCDSHNYKGMLQYLDDSSVIKLLYKDQDFQTYYYYYGVATFQYSHDTKLSLRYLKLAYKYTVVNNQKVFTPNEILILSGIAYLKVKSIDEVDGFKDFETALNYIENHQFTHYDENINILYYQYGISLYKKKQYEKAILILNMGIEWTTLNSSHYMLSDLFFALSKSYNIVNKKNEYNEALSKSQVIEDIFKQKTYKNEL